MKRFGLLMLPLGLLACTPPAPQMNVEDAMLACRAAMARPVTTDVQLGVGINGSGTVSTGANVGVNVDIGALTNPQRTFARCVQRNSGQLPTAPL